MVSHTEYPFNGEYQLDYPDQLQGGDVITFLGTVGHYNEWHLYLCVNKFETTNDIFATFLFRGGEHGLVFRSNCYLSFLNYKDKSKSKVNMTKFDSSREFPCLGPILLESEVLDEEDGWLKDGKLTVEYGIHVEAFKDTVWQFSFNHPIFQHEKTKPMISFERKEDKNDFLYCHKQLLIHHSSSIAKNSSKNNWHLELEENFSIFSLENCLQIVHGTHIKFDLIDLLGVLRIAHYYRLYNVIRYCEMELIQIKDKITFVKGHIQFATHYKFNRYLASVLREIESPETIKEYFCHVDIGSMTGEMMKQCVMKLLGFY